MAVAVYAALSSLCARACVSCPVQQYNPELDRKNFEEEIKRLAKVPDAVQEMARMHVLDRASVEAIAHEVSEHKAEAC